MTKNNYSVVAAIDVGTNNLQMTVVQVNQNGEIIILEDLKRPTTIGSDTFSVGRIMIPTIHEMLEILKGFRQKLKEYKVKSYRALSTSALREAENREYVLELIRIHTGIQIEVINNSQERYYMYQALRHQSHINMDKHSTLILNIASGGLEISIHDQGELRLMEYLNIGALRIHEMLSELMNKTIGIASIMEEYIYGRLSRIRSIITDADVKSFIGLGREINTIFGLCCDNNGLTVESNEINTLYQKIKNMTNDKLMDTYGLTSKQVETLLPSVIILNLLLIMSNTKRMQVPKIELRHGIICELADEQYQNTDKEDASIDILHSVWFINKKYELERKHSENVSKLSTSIFEQTKRLHRLGARECLYLKIASILHGMGYYVNHSAKVVITYELIRKQNITGLSNREMEIVANIASYYGDEVPRQHHENYQKLTYDDKIIVVKLVAILKLADSLEISHTGKISKVQLDIQGDIVYFTLQTQKHTQLEEWIFAKRAQFFEEVLGVRAQIKKKH